MAQDIIDGINPTRMELLSLKNRTKLAVKGHGLLKEKRDALIKEFFDILDRVKGIRENAELSLKEANEALVEAQIARIPCFVSDKVNESAIISNLVTRISLRDSAEKWADMVLSYEKPKRIMVKDADWDIKKITKKLERIYLDALTEQRDGKK